MSKVQKIAFLYLLTLIIFFYGYAVARFEVPPHTFLESRIQELKAFTAGDTLEKKTSVFQKLKNDTGVTPLRYTYSYPESINNLGPHSSLATSGLKSRRDQPQVYINDQYTSGYRVIIGALDFEESFWGALLISPKGEAIHTWHLSTEHLPGNSVPDNLKNLYGVHVGRDASITFTMQEVAGGIVKVDVCSNEIWNLPGSYHHTVTSDDNGAFWSFTGEQKTLDQNMVKFSSETGEILKTIHMKDVRQKNPNVNIWNLIYPSNDVNVNYIRLAAGSLSHGNDIDPLTKDLAASFEQFEVGDLLVSYAATNLIFILDPDSLEIKWWRIGIADAQHDPDWERDGRIGIYDNQMRNQKNYSRIVSIDPKTFEYEVIFDGRKNQFKSDANGMHQRTVYNTRMVTSAQQGWAFEIDQSGETVFSFINSYDRKDKTALHLSEALHYPVSYFEGKPWEDCEPRN